MFFTWENLYHCSQFLCKAQGAAKASWTGARAVTQGSTSGGLVFGLRLCCFICLNILISILTRSLAFLSHTRFQKVASPALRIKAECEATGGGGGGGTPGLSEASSWSPCRDTGLAVPRGYTEPESQAPDVTQTLSFISVTVRRPPQTPQLAEVRSSSLVCSPRSVE